MATWSDYHRATDKVHTGGNLDDECLDCLSWFMNMMGKTTRFKEMTEKYAREQKE